MNKLVVIFCIHIIFISPALADKYFNKLIKCDEIEKLISRLKHSDRFRKNCMVPASRVEKGLMERTKMADPMVCLVGVQSKGFLAGFNCVSQLREGKGELSCFRIIDNSFINEYKSDSTYYGDVAKSYLSMASTCDYGGHDSPDASWPQMPGLLGLVSKFEFGFITSIGKSEVFYNSYATHGFASVDPSIVNNERVVIEYFSILSGERNTTYDGTIIHESEKLVVVFNDARDYENEMNRMLVKSNQGLRVNISDYTLRCKLDIPYVDRKKRVRHLLRNVGRSIKRQGLSKEHGLKFRGASIHDVFVNTKRFVPYNYAEHSDLNTVIDKVVYVSNSNPSCTNYDKGSIVAMTFVTEPNEFVISDCGSISLAVAGEGVCSRFSALSTHKYITGLINATTEQITTDANWD